MLRQYEPSGTQGGVAVDAIHRWRSPAGVGCHYVETKESFQLFSAQGRELRNILLFDLGLSLSSRAIGTEALLQCEPHSPLSLKNAGCTTKDINKLNFKII